MPDPADVTPIAFNDTGNGWHLKPRRRHLQRGLVVLALLLAVFGAVDAARDGNPAAATALGAGVVVVLAIVLERPGARAPRMHESPTSYGLLLPIHPVKLAIIASLAIAGVGLCVGPPVAVVTGVGGAGNDASVVEKALALVLCLAVGLLFVAGAAGGIASRRTPHRGILLTVDGVVLQTQKPPASFPWHHCREVRTHWTRVRGMRNSFLTPDDVIVSWLTFAVDPADVDGRAPLATARTDEPSIDVRHLAMDPYLALEVARFYLADAEARAELRTTAALDRVASIERSLTPPR